MPGPQVPHGRVLAERCRAGQARPLPGARGGADLSGTHICVPYKPSGNVRRGGIYAARAVCGSRKPPRRGQDPSLRCHDNGCFVGSGLDRSVPVRGGANLPGTHICVPYKPSGNVRVVYRCGNTVGAGHARPAGVPWAGACGKVQGRACPAPTGDSRRREPPRGAYMRPLQPLRERSGRVQVRKHCRGRACPAPTAMQILPFFVPPPDDLGF